jgi:hypothetical protein
MKLLRTWTIIEMTLLQLFRRQITLILLIVIPTVFFLVVYYTTTDRVVPFKLATVSETTMIEVSERSESLVFIGVAAVGFLASFLALNLVQKNAIVHRRMVLCGYRSWEIFAALFFVLLIMVSLLAIYVSTALNLFFDLNNAYGVFLGMFAAGMVYGSYGLLSGIIIRGELEGILLIVLLANIDAGWLQNPLFYEGAQNKEFIRYLPAWFPSQVSLTAAFTDHLFTKSLLYAMIYGFGLLGIGLLFYIFKMRIFR